MARHAIGLGAMLGGLLYAGCSGADPTLGQQAIFRIQGAQVQYIPGAIDTSARDPLPAVANVSTQNPTLFPGVANKKLSGSVGPNSTAVLVGLQGDIGHWVVPVQDPDPNVLGNYTFSFSASFSYETPAGDLLLAFRATSRDGKIGPAWLQPLNMDVPQVEGTLVIALDWDTEADLDLHVQLPSNGDGGVNEIWSRKPSGLPLAATGTPPTVDEGKQAGYLDIDSNNQCVIDGRREENVIFPSSPPPGRYIVRVDTFSLCSEATARWRVRVFTNNGLQPGTTRFGQSTEIDTRFPHGQGQGVQALVFDN